MNNINLEKKHPHICRKCKSADVIVGHESDVVDFKGLTLEVSGLAYTRCNSCGLRWYTDGQEQDNLSILKQAFVEKRDLVRNQEGLLTGAQIAQILSELNLNKAEAAAVFGGGPNAFSKYISGDVLQSFAMDRLLRIALGFGDHAVRYLRLGAQAPLVKASAGVYISPLPNSGIGMVIFTKQPGSLSVSANAVGNSSPSTYVVTTA